MAYIMHRSSQYCFSADVNCGINCTSPVAQPFVQTCNNIRSASGCSAADIDAKRWVRIYWADVGSERNCNEGIQPMKAPGIMQQLFCCAGTQSCNKPGAAVPPIKCFQTSTTFPTGTCANKTATYSVCAVNQERANQKAAAVTSELSPHQLIFDCPSAVTRTCATYGRAVSATKWSAETPLLKIHVTRLTPIGSSLVLP
jgi:hypothetical protein